MPNGVTLKRIQGSTNMKHRQWVLHVDGMDVFLGYAQMKRVIAKCQAVVAEQEKEWEASRK